MKEQTLVHKHASQLILLMNQCGVSCAQIARDMEVRPSQVHRWRAMSTAPKAQALDRLMELAERVSRNAKSVALLQHTSVVQESGGK